MAIDVPGHTRWRSRSGESGIAVIDWGLVMGSRTSLRPLSSPGPAGGCRFMTPRTVLVTGGNRGIGCAIAEEFVAQGHRVAVTARSGAGTGWYRSPSRGTSPMPPHRRRLHRGRGRSSGRSRSSSRTPASRATRCCCGCREEDFTDVVDTNLSGAFRVVKRASKGMLKAKFGRIILVSSVVGLFGGAGQVNYSASKTGLVGMARSITRELGSRGITANVVAPGFIETDMTANCRRSSRPSTSSRSRPAASRSRPRSPRSSPGSRATTPPTSRRSHPGRRRPGDGALAFAPAGEPRVEAAREGRWLGDRSTRRRGDAVRIDYAFSLYIDAAIELRIESTLEYFDGHEIFTIVPENTVAVTPLLGLARAPVHRLDLRASGVLSVHFSEGRWLRVDSDPNFESFSLNVSREGTNGALFVGTPGGGITAFPATDAGPSGAATARGRVRRGACERDRAPEPSRRSRPRGRRSPSSGGRWRHRRPRGSAIAGYRRPSPTR